MHSIYYYYYYYFKKTLRSDKKFSRHLMFISYETLFKKSKTKDNFNGNIIVVKSIKFKIKELFNDILKLYFY